MRPPSFDDIPCGFRGSEIGKLGCQVCENKPIIRACAHPDNPTQRCLRSKPPTPEGNNWLEWTCLDCVLCGRAEKQALTSEAPVPPLPQPSSGNSLPHRPGLRRGPTHAALARSAAGITAEATATSRPPRRQMPDGEGWISDPLARAAIKLPSLSLRAEICVATVASPGFEGWLDTMLGSLSRWGNLAGALRVVFTVDDIWGSCRELAEQHGCQVIECRSLAPIDAGIKSILYSVASVVQAEHFLCLDSDMLIFDDLRPLLAEATSAPGKILVANNDSVVAPPTLGQQFVSLYKGHPHELACLASSAASLVQLDQYPIVVNDGLMCGDTAAFRQVEQTIRQMPAAISWIEHAPHLGYRNQMALNAALALTDSGQQTAAKWNVQLHYQQLQPWTEQEGLPVAQWNAARVGVLHFTGPSKPHFSAERMQYATQQLGGEVRHLPPNISKSTEIYSRNQIPQLLQARGLYGQGVEVGVHRGEFAAQILADWPGTKLWLVDNYQETHANWSMDRPADLAAAKLRLAPHADRIEWLIQDSASALATLPAASLVLGYIDACHHYESVVADLGALWPKIIPGGLLAGHDFCTSLPGVVQAVSEFAAREQVQVFLTREWHQWWSWYCFKPIPNVPPQSVPLVLEGVLP